MDLKCYACVAEYKVALDKADTLEMQEREDAFNNLPELEDAATFVPVWQQQQMMGQIVMACVSLPACIRHIMAKEPTPEEKAVAGGYIIPGRGAAN
jgi:hypothetical protein